MLSSGNELSQIKGGKIRPEPHLAAAQAVEQTLLKQLRNDTGNADRLILKFGDRPPLLPRL